MRRQAWSLGTRGYERDFSDSTVFYFRLVMSALTDRNISLPVLPVPFSFCEHELDYRRVQFMIYQSTTPLLESEAGVEWRLCCERWPCRLGPRMRSSDDRPRLEGGYPGA